MNNVSLVALSIAAFASLLALVGLVIAWVVMTRDR